MCERYIDRLPLAHPQLGTWPTTQASALMGNQTSEPLVHRPVLTPLSYTSQGGHQNFLLYDVSAQILSLCVCECVCVRVF